MNDGFDNTFTQECRQRKPFVQKIPSQTFSKSDRVLQVRPLATQTKQTPLEQFRIVGTF